MEPPATNDPHGGRWRRLLWIPRSMLANSVGTAVDYALLMTATMVFGARTVFAAGFATTSGATINFLLNRRVALGRSMTRIALGYLLATLSGCGCGARVRSVPRTLSESTTAGPEPDAGPPATAEPRESEAARFPLVRVADVDLPGRATRFDYQDVDAAHGLLGIAHMGDSEVLLVDLRDGATRARIGAVATVRGVLATGTGPIFASAAASDEVVLIDAATLTETARVPAGRAPDGLGWDPGHEVLAVSDQRAGAVSLLADVGRGTRRQVNVGRETGNVVFDATRGVFWVAVVDDAPPDRLVAIDPVTATAGVRIDLPGCAGAHGVRLHPDGQSAFVACEDGDRLARVELDGAHRIVTERVGSGPDVLAIDPGLGLLYVAAENGDLTVVDLRAPGIVVVDREHVGDRAHTVAVDPATHRVFFPLQRGPRGTPVLRILRPGS